MFLWEKIKSYSYQGIFSFLFLKVSLISLCQEFTFNQYLIELRLSEKERERERERKLNKGGGGAKGVEKCDYKGCSDAGSLNGLCESEYIHPEKESSSNENDFSFLKKKENCGGT